jgi:hypothetical protein
MNSCDEAVQTAKLAEYIKLKTEEDIHFLAKNSKMLIFKRFFIAKKDGFKSAITDAKRLRRRTLSMI